MKPKACFIVIAFIALTFVCDSSISAQQKDRSQIKKEIDALNQQIKEKEAELLKPSQEAQQTYAEFLKQPETGLIRLLPRERYDRKLTITGGGSYYSFVLRTHEYGRGSDIGLEQNYFKVGFAGADYGFLLNLGDVPIEEVTTETNGVKYLAEYTPPTKEKEVRDLLQQRWQGIEIDKYVYRSHIQAKVGDTYVVRSINFDDSDCLVTFRVIDEDFDGSMTVIWKRLKTFPTPILERMVR